MQTQTQLPSLAFQVVHSTLLKLLSLILKESKELAYSAEAPMDQWIVFKNLEMMEKERLRV